jgi:LytR cell envelope-related transcriptional attenuator
MDLILAFSLQDQVEKYGAYVGLAAFIGLAVLSLLYFAQARELKRLRDWAGRAPERAAELQARVVAQAEESLRAPEVEPAVERSGTVGPAQPVAAPAAGNGHQVGAPIPMGPRPAVAMAAIAARAAAAPATAVEEEPGTAVVPTGEDGAAPAPVAVPSGDEGAPPADEAASPPDEPPPASPEEEPAEAEPAAGEAAESAGADSGEESAGADSSEAELARSGNGVPAKPPAELPETTIPRATPRPQPKPQPRPVPAAAAPLRASTTRSATPRRTRPQRDDSRTGLYTLIGIVVLAVAIFVPVYFMVLSGDETTPPPNPIAEPGGTPASDAGAGERAAAARPDKVVVVLNGTSIDGLASRERDSLIQAGYADGMIRIDNSDDQSRQDSLVLYAEDERRQARDVARLLDISRMEVIDEETQALADSSDESGTLPADVVVMLGTDKSP